MKRILTVLMLLQFVMLSYSRVVKMEYTDAGIEIEYDFSDVKVTVDSNDSTLHISVPGCMTTLGEGIPALPYRGERFEIPRGIEMGEIQIQETCEIVKGQCALAALFHSDSLDLPEEESINSITPYYGLWPSQTAVLGRSGIYRDRTIGSIVVYPVKYDYAREQIVISKALKIIIPFIVQPKMMAMDGEAEQELHSLPKDMFSSLAPLNVSYSNEVSPMGGVYQPPVQLPTLMLIAPKSFEEPTRKFGKWKQRMGYSVHVEIVEDAATLLDPEATRQLIRNRYKSDKKLEYVLLMGGGDIIRPFVGKHSVKFSGYPLQKTYTDFYFTCMDGESDTFADLAIGRFPAHNVDDLTIMINKTIGYEKNPPISDASFYSTGLHISEWIGTSKNSSNNVEYENSNFIWTCEWFKNMMEHEFDYDIKRLYYKKSSGNPSYYANNLPLEQSTQRYLNYNSMQAPEVSQAIENGAWYVLCRSHGSVHEWTNARYNEQFVRSLTNGNKLPILYSINCYSGAIYNPKAFASYNDQYSLCEEFLRNPNGGAVCAIGANDLTETHYNDMLTAGLFNQMYGTPAMDFEIPENPIFGEKVVESCMSLVKFSKQL